MKRQASQLSFLLAAFAFAPAALAGSEIVKCVDPSGHVTLTDQPCSASAETVRLTPVAASGPAGETAPGADELVADADVSTASPVATAERHTVRALVRQSSWKTPPAPGSRPLARDVATLKAARLQMLMLDGATRRQPTLASIQFDI